MKMSHLNVLTIIVVGLTSMCIPRAIAFDGTDSEPPRVISMRLLSEQASGSNDLVMVEVITQDDKNWVKVTGTTQVGYSFAIKNNNVAPNCAVGTTAFSRLEVIEDERARSSPNLNPKKQRFLLIGFLPKPKILPTNCPEYRNLDVAPSVVLNSTVFPFTQNKTTGVKTYTNSILTPAIQDEAGRNTSGTISGGIAPGNLSFAKQNISEENKFCVSYALLPRINQSIQNIQSKYKNVSAVAYEKYQVFDMDTSIALYEIQSIAWESFLLDFTLVKLKEISKCSYPLTVQQIITAYQKSIKSIELLLASQARIEFEVSCKALNVEVQQILDLLQVLKGEQNNSLEYREFISKSQGVKILDCAKISTKVFEDAQTKIEAIESLRESYGSQFLTNYCQTRKMKELQFAELSESLAIRYQSVAEYVQWRMSLQIPTFGPCEPDLELSQLLTYGDNFDDAIRDINAVLLKLKNLEGTKGIKVTIKCQKGKKLIQRTGKPPKCPQGYRELKVSLAPIQVSVVGGRWSVQS